MKAIVTSIKYDTDGLKIKLPKVLEFDVPIDMDEEERLDFVADEISNITGFCHKSFKVTLIQDTEKTNVEFYVVINECDDNNPYEEVVAVFIDEKYYSEANIGYGRVTKEDVENTFMGYVHLGQHIPVSKYFFQERCRKATEEEYQYLKTELESIGYNLNIL